MLKWSSCGLRFTKKIFIGPTCVIMVVGNMNLLALTQPTTVVLHASLGKLDHKIGAENID